MKEIRFKEIDSTNDYCKRNIEELEHFTVVQSTYQTHGRGRQDHTWDSVANKNLLISIVIKDFNDLPNVQQLTQVIAYAIVTTLQEYQIEARVKWPNDIFVQDKKICGILIETIIEEKLKGIVVGVGLNVMDTKYQSISNVLKQEVEIEEVKQKLLQQIQVTYQRYRDGKYVEILNAINACSYLKGKWFEHPTFGVVEYATLLQNNRVQIRDTSNRYYEIYVNEISLHNQI